MRHISAALLLGSALVASSWAHAATVAISCGAVGQELQALSGRCRGLGQEDRQRGKDHQTPNSATERLALYQQILAAGSADIDVFQIDVIWPGILANHMIDLSSKIPADVLSQHFKAIVDNNTVGGKLVAMPWFTDAGVLYYRKDLLEKYGKQPPQTWQELTDDRQGDPGRRAHGRQRQDVGLRLPGQGL